MRKTSGFGWKSVPDATNRQAKFYIALSAGSVVVKIRRIGAGNADFAAKTANFLGINDWLAERVVFELSVRFLGNLPLKSRHNWRSQGDQSRNRD